MIREYRDPRQGEVFSFLSIHAHYMKQYGQDEIRFRPCPKCHYDKSSNPAIQINMKSGLWKCYHCGTTGNWFTLTREFGCPLPINDRYKDIQFPPINIDWVKFFKTKKRRPVTGNHYPELLEYLRNRGFSDETLDKWRISTKGPCAIRVPLYQWDGTGWQMVNARVRVCLDREDNSVNDWFDMTGGPTNILMGNHLMKVDGPKRAIIFEGQWDAMTATELGLENVFSLPNGAQSIHCGQFLRYIPDDWEVWVCTDMDKSGEDAVEKFFAQVGPCKMKRLKIKKPYKDLNEWYQADPFMTSDQLIEGLIGLSELKIEGGMVGNYDSFMTIDLSSNESSKKTVICSTPWNKLNKMLKGGLLGGQTTGLLAPSGRGKTTWCNQLATHAACLGVRTGLISLEGARQDLNAKIREIVINTFSREDHKRVLDNLKISRLEGSKVSPEMILSEFNSMIQNHFCKLLIIDNLDFVSRDDNVKKIRAYAELIDIAVKNLVHIIVVWQPHKVDRNAIVNSGNQKGYSQTFQDSDNYLNLNRIGGYIVMELEKSRSYGEPKDNKIKLLYDESSRTFHQYSDPNKEYDGKVIRLNS